ncbi:MAG: hypothetical protein SVK08_01610 [Halobacteriota archaeon]|nr:hypothetical protein [Halobacteriota archaeon]
MTDKSMEFLFDNIPDFYRDFFEDKDMLLTIWGGYKSKFMDDYNRLYELASSISLPRSPYVHREYYPVFYFDNSTMVSQRRFRVDQNLVKIDFLSESADIESANFYLEEGKDYRIMVDESGQKVIEFIRTSRCILKFTYDNADHPEVPAGSRFKVDGEDRYMTIVDAVSGEDAVGYYIIEENSEGVEANPLTESNVLLIPSELSYISNIEIVSVEGEENYLSRLGVRPIPRTLFAYRAYRDTQIIEKNFGRFIGYGNSRLVNDLEALRGVIYNSDDPTSDSFYVENKGLIVEEDEILQSSSRWMRELELYKLRVNALWFALWNGPSEFNLNVAASIFIGLPISELEGEVKEKKRDHLNRWVVTITDGTKIKEYTLPKGVSPDENILPGMPIALFQPIARNAARVYDQFIDEEKFKASLADLYDVLVDNVDEECGILLDDDMNFDQGEPCERWYLDSCTPDSIDDDTICYKTEDISNLHFVSYVTQIVDSTHVRMSKIPPIGTEDTYQIQSMNGDEIEEIKIIGFDLGSYVATLENPLENDYDIGAMISDRMSEFYYVEDDLDCIGTRDRACSTSFEDPNNPGETITSRNFPEDFYENFRYIFLVDILGGITLSEGDFDGLYDFLYRIKPHYAHFLINMLIGEEENLKIETEEGLTTDVCELYDEKKLFFDNYLPDPEDPDEMYYASSDEKKGFFLDDPRFCIPSLFDSGSPSEGVDDTELTDEVDVLVVFDVNNQIDFGTDESSP